MTTQPPAKRSAVHDSAKKAARKSVRQHARNKSVRSAVRTRVKQVDQLIAEQDLAQADTALRQAIQALDRAEQKGIIHPNNAARRKSRLLRRLTAAKAVTAAKAATAPKPRRRTRRTAAKA